jgi:hypothetical protein
MEPNPYQSPRVLQPVQEQEPADANSVRQLLVEIRDGQRELLQLQREALKTQMAFGRYRPLAFILPILIVALSYGSIFWLRSTAIRPAAVPPRPVPSRVPPNLTPPSASVGQRRLP